ncbi:PREDICTED: uncharacterized protein LOC109466773 isoform X1 [Branchiostoma belcheri]|uniref:Uncharacterized protein LOC109466773 isoform X1 n=1 Tax=Branchiostoma belcheri TaxID=7741 RepID=A0A6P4YDD2_BRABE|nr:PREDICTED: uncharacterized protein LOC109466773 isoform X1 [Branchiostoma belcheri]
MSDNNMTSLAAKLQNLELCLKSHHSQDHGYGQALREAILCMDHFMEVEVLKSLGDLHLQKGKLSKDSEEFDKAAALYAAALLRCKKEPDMCQTLQHRIDYMEKLSRQLLQGYTPQYQRLSPDISDSNVLRVAEICHKLDRVGKLWKSVEDTYTEALVTAIENSDVFLELEILKSLGDFYLEKGKKTSDTSQFSKAAAMYNKALTRCEDPETKLTLRHRISYAEKIREAVRKPTLSKSRPREKRPSLGHQFGNMTRPNVTQTCTDIQSQLQYKDHMKKGESSLDKEDLDSAEEHFAAALKTVHMPDPTAQQYQREVEPLCKLGDVYSKRGQQTGDGGDFVKAAALYHAAIARSEDQVLNSNIERAVTVVEKSFLKYVLNIHCDIKSLVNTDRHKKQLKEMRDQIKLEMETIDQQLDPYVHDESDPRVKEIEAKRAQAVRQLFDKIAQERKEFISLLVEECIGLMGPLPCKYALIGLGSQATGLVTPYSDLESAILVEEEREECLVHFYNLTHYLHLKMVNLGETILPALGIKSLNDFYSENSLDNWYYDSVTPRGFAFDGSMPKASKTPLGRQGTSQLICTPNNMASKLQTDATLYLKEGYHLAIILRNPCLIAGDQGLIETYMAITRKIMQADGGRMSQQLAEEIQRENIKKLSDNGKETVTARLIDVKKKLYRFPAIAIDCLALSSHIRPTTVWKMIEEMESKQVISPNNAHHLTVLTSISAELRLRTYIANGGQKENLSAMASMETVLDQQTNELKPVFHLPNERQLFRYYHTAVPLKSVLTKWSEKNPCQQPFSDLYDNSPRVQGLMYRELCKYRLALRYYHEALKTADGTDTKEMILLLCDIGLANLEVGDHHKAISYYEQALTMHGKTNGQSTAHLIIDNTAILNNLGTAWSSLGDQRKAITYNEQALQMYRNIYGQSTEHPAIAKSLGNLGLAWHSLGDYRKAIGFDEQALKMFRGIYGETKAHPQIATLLGNLGGSWGDLGEYRRAVSYYEEALQMRRDIYGQSTPHPDIAISLGNIGATWHKLGDYRKSIIYHEQAIKMSRSIYGETKAHPHIATLLNNLGQAWDALGDYRKAISYYEEALQMKRDIYGQSTPHPDIAISLANLGSAWCRLGDYRKAISFHEQALKMFRSIYGETKSHPHIATSLNNLGLSWDNLGDYRRAVSYYEESLQMRRDIYGQSTEHPDIAMSLNNLGLAWHSLGDYRKAISFHEQALKMSRSIYGETKAHPHIATSLSNLGASWSDLGDYRRAVSYYEEALQMRRDIYGQTTPHPDIAISLGSLGTAWHSLGDDRKAIMYHEQALKMFRNIYGQNKAHPYIATSLGNLGTTWQKLDYYRKAIIYHEQALRMSRSIYGETKAHPDIATSLNNLGRAWGALGDYRRAVSYYKEALQMRRDIYGQSTPHPEIAITLVNMGSAWHSLADYRKAISFHEQALKMLRSIYGETKSHPHIAGLLNNLGASWGDLGDYRRAVSYYEEALQMRRDIYGQSTPHPAIATSLSNLGTAWQHLGDYRKAISYHEQALKMSRSIYGETKAHSHIATSLNNLGASWDALGDYRKAIACYEEVLKMQREIHGYGTPHPAIATSLNNLGTTLYKLCDFRAANRTFLEALVMAKQIFPQDQNHPLIKKIERNLAENQLKASIILFQSLCKIA